MPHVEVTDVNVLSAHPEWEEYLQFYRVIPDWQLRENTAAPAGLFMAETPKVIAQALRAGLRPQSLLLPESFVSASFKGCSAAPPEGCSSASSEGCPSVSSEENPWSGILWQFEHRWPEAPVFVVAKEVFSSITGYKTIRGGLAVFERPALLTVEELLGGFTGDVQRVAVLEDVGNYRNIGSAFRAAASFGIDAVLVTHSCHDPLYRRAARESKGAVLQIPWTRIGTEQHWAAEGVPLLHRLGFKVAALALRDDTLSLDALELATCEKLALVLGTEGEGLAEETIALCDYTVKIPMAHEVDSLNVAAASAVAFWELSSKLRP